MVRHKSRWLLVNLMTPSSSNDELLTSSSSSIEKKHIYHALRSTIDSSFGIAGSALTCDIQVKYYHPDVNIVIIKVPRDSHKLIRAALTLISQINNQSMVTSVISIHGSARTCKIATIRYLRKWFNEYCNTVNNNNDNGDDRGDIMIDAGLKKLQTQLEEINALD